MVELEVLRTQNLLGLSIWGALENCVFDLAIEVFINASKNLMVWAETAKSLKPNALLLTFTQDKGEVRETLATRDM